MWDIIMGGGYPFSFKQGRLLLSPLFGFSLHRQSLRITNGQQVVSVREPAPTIGPLDASLNSLYSAHWNSIWIGCDLRHQMKAPSDGVPPMEFALSFAYHFWADYHAEADWNVRNDLDHPVSFEHDADAHGVSLQAEWMLRMTSRLNLRCNLNYSFWSSDSGKVTTHQTVPEVMTITSRFNEVTWESKSIMVGAIYRFF
jgi:hypothetical protein